MKSISFEISLLSSVIMLHVAGAVAANPNLTSGVFASSDNDTLREVVIGNTVMVRGAPR